MEKVLEKMAKQLNALDEASLMSLWEKYAKAAKEFEPTKRWEESALILCFIQAMHWKNMLFNHHWSTWTRPEKQKGLDVPEVEDPILESLREAERGEVEGAGSEYASNGLKRCKVLSFRPREDEDTV